MSKQFLPTIFNSMANNMFQTYFDSLTHNELKHLCKVIHYPSIPDRYFVDNPSIYPFIRWDKLTKMQAVRVVIRNSELLERVDLKKYDYRIKEVFFLIKQNPEMLFTHFNFNFSNLSHDDAYFLACLGNEEYINMLNLDNYNFNFIESMNIIKSHNYNKKIIMLLPYLELKSYQISEILINTGETCMDLFDLTKLTTLDWLDLLPHQPDFLDYCDFEIFKKGDPFNLIQLVVMFDEPDLSHLIFEIDKRKITAFGWEKLLISNPDKYIDICDFYKIRENNWLVISHYHPHLLVHKL